MKTYHLRVTRAQVKYCSVTAKSLEEAVAQADYQLLVNPPRLIDGTIKETKTYDYGYGERSYTNTEITPIDNTSNP